MIDETSSSPNRPPAPPEAWEPLLRLARLAARPLDRFLHIEAASGILLMVSAAFALVMANSRWADAYAHFWHIPLGLHIGAYHFERSLEWVVNDGLMVIFFFVVGLEIKRELHHGELSEWRRASLPALAALGGMLVPAGLYLVIAGAPSTRSGWGVPMATDIAFAVGVLTLLGSRVPAALRVLLLALAVIDDLGAILGIALFYSEGLNFAGFGVAALGVGGVLAMRGAGVRTRMLYVVPGLVVWAGIYGAGVHPTIAGVIMGLLTPVRAWLGPDGFVQSVRQGLDEMTHTDVTSLSSHHLAISLARVNEARREALSPTEGLIEVLHPWVAFLIMPIFALANAGVSLGQVSLGGDGGLVALGVAAGLVLGKPIGVMVACEAAIRLNISTLPAGLSRRHLLVLGMAAGIGFTMALFVAQLAFSDVTLLGPAKLGILIASGVAGVLCVVGGRVLLPLTPQGQVATTADEAESSTIR